VHAAAENERTAREVTLTELRERTAAVVAAVAAGEVGVVSKHGRPVAILIPFADRDTLAPASPEAAGLARLAERFGRRRLGREWSALMHGRWVNGGGIHGRYR
jgi:prevent-host-death family protein